jgi:3D (Asp-Asp-Asp) domain-containing protein
MNNHINKFLILTFLILSAFSFTRYKASASKPEANNDVLGYKTEVKTISKFADKEVTEDETVPFEKKFVEDESLPFGELEKASDGKDGKIVRTYSVNLYNGEEIDKKLIKTETISPTDETYKRGTKINWKEETSDRCGKFKYWHKYEKVYMTTYTPQCEGCDAWTSIGMKAGYGVIAVDPKKIPYHTKVCIPGYGIAVAGDTGGAMRSYRGLLIDLGFNSMSPQDKWMTTGRYDMYILNNEGLKDKFFLETPKTD